MYTKTEVFFCPAFQISLYVTFSLDTDYPKSRFSEIVLTFEGHTALFTNANFITHTSEKIPY
jgi:hypothetical protein